MKTTLEFPDELIRQAQAEATRLGLTLEEWVQRLVAKTLTPSSVPPELLRHLELEDDLRRSVLVA